MRSVLQSAILGLSLLAGAASISGQSENADGQEQIPEERQGDFEYSVLMTMAVSADRNLKERTLLHLAERIADGVDAESSARYESILEYLASEGTSVRRLGTGRSSDEFVDIRWRAVRLIGQLQGARAKEILIAVITIDHSVSVLTEAAFALGNLSVTPGDGVVDALAHATRQIESRDPDNNALAFAIIASIEEIADTNRGRIDASAYEALFEIAQGSYRQSVRNKALDVLMVLIEYE